MLKYVLLSTLSIFLLACEADTQNQSSVTATYHKSQGQCGETWGEDFLDYEPGTAEDTARELLADMDITITALQMDSLHQLYVCATCHDCPSGWYYILEADVAYSAQLEDLGFEQQ